MSVSVLKWRQLLRIFPLQVFETVAGDGARELLPPWTAGPGVQKDFDPEHTPRDGGTQLSLALFLYFSFNLCFVSSHMYPTPIRRPSTAHSLL